MVELMDNSAIRNSVRHIHLTAYLPDRRVDEESFARFNHAYSVIERVHRVHTLSLSMLQNSDTPYLATAYCLALEQIMDLLPSLKHFCIKDMSWWDAEPPVPDEQLLKRDSVLQDMLLRVLPANLMSLEVQVWHMTSYHPNFWSNVLATQPMLQSLSIHYVKDDDMLGVFQAVAAAKLERLTHLDIRVVDRPGEDEYDSNVPVEELNAGMLDIVKTYKQLKHLQWHCPTGVRATLSLWTFLERVSRLKELVLVGLLFRMNGPPDKQLVLTCVERLELSYCYTGKQESLKWLLMVQWPALQDFSGYYIYWTAPLLEKFLAQTPSLRTFRMWFKRTPFVVTGDLYKALVARVLPNIRVLQVMDESKHCKATNPPYMIQLRHAFPRAAITLQNHKKIM